MAARKVIQYSAVPNYGDNFDVVGGHGTHTTGTMVGSITDANGDYTQSKFFPHSYHDIHSMSRIKRRSICNGINHNNDDDNDKNGSNYNDDDYNDDNYYYYKNNHNSDNYNNNHNNKSNNDNNDSINSSSSSSGSSKGRRRWRSK